MKILKLYFDKKYKILHFEKHYTLHNAIKYNGQHYFCLMRERNKKKKLF